MEPARTPPVAPPAPAERVPLWRQLRDRDHTRGSLLASLVVLALPSILTMMAGGVLYQLFDLKFVGTLGSDALAVVGVTNQTLRQFPFLIVMGCGIATQAMIARLVGQGRVEGAEHVAGQALLLGACVGAAVAMVGALLPETLLGLFVRDPDALAAGVPYVRLTFTVLLGQIVSQLFVSILSGAGESTTPMLITLATTPIAITAEWCLIFGHFGLPAFGLIGVALGMGVGATSSLAISLWALFTGRCRVHLRLHHLAPDPAVLRTLAATSWQPATHLLARTLMVFFFMWLAGRLGTHVQAAYTVGLRIELVAFMVGFPIANACATLVGQNLGASDIPRAWSAIRTGIAVETAIMLCFAAALLTFRADLVAFFTPDPEVRAVATEYLGFSAVGFAFYGVYFIGFRALQAAGDMTSPMLISVGSALLLGAPLAWGLAAGTDLGPTGMWIGNLAYAALNTVLTAAWLARGGWAHRHRTRSPDLAPGGSEAVG